MESCIHRGLVASHLGQSIHRCYHSDTTIYCSLEGESKYDVCDGCKHREEETHKDTSFSTEGWQFIKTSKLIEDSLELCRHVPANCKGIVGIPRSGMLPATALATHLHLPLYALKENGIIEVGSGTRLKKLQSDGPYFVVDDSIYEGNTMWLVKEQLENEHYISAVVYAYPDAASKVDFYSMLLPAPHLFEWNVFNNGLMVDLSDRDPDFTGIAIDFDGILCDDPLPGDDRSSDLKWLENLAPGRYVPRKYPIELIITNRLEKWRKETEVWLKKYRIEYTKLIMSPYDTVESRDANFPKEIIWHKGQEYEKSNCMLYIESDPMQAELIFDFSKKPVLCPATGQLFQ